MQLGRVLDGHDLAEHGAELARGAALERAGFDGSPDAVAAIKAGELQYSVLQPVAVYSAKAVQEADSFIKTGKTVYREIARA